jgi:hypothetical protein
MRATFKFMLVLLSFLLASGIYSNSEYDWQLVRDNDGIQIYLKKFWADDIKSFRGVIHIPSPMESVLAVIIDIKSCPEWVHRCKKPALLLRKSFSECYHYQIHSLPFPARNREFIFHSKITQIAETGAIKIQMNAKPEFCQSNGGLCAFNKESSLVRVTHSHGHYLLEAINKHQTRVTWTHHTNPAGHLPKWMINSLIQEMPFRTLQGLRKKVLNQKYQKGKIISDSKGNIIDLIMTP